MARLIVGVVVTVVVGGVLAPDLGPVPAIALAVIFGFWVLLGLGSAVARAEVRPLEHHVKVVGAVAHVVVDDNAERRDARRPARARVIECPECAVLIEPEMTACPLCDWQVPSVARGVKPALPAMAQSQAPRAEAQMPCPACPRCRAPTTWIEKHERFMCEGCALYV